MKRKSVLVVIMPLLIAFVIGVLLNFFVIQHWPNFSDILTLLLLFLLGVIPTVLLRVLQKPSMLISLLTSWFLWLGIIFPAFFFPQMVTITFTGCFATACETCPTQGCAPEVVPATSGLIGILFVAGLGVVTIGSLLFSSGKILGDMGDTPNSL